MLHTSSSPCANLPFLSFILLQLSTFPPLALLTSFQNNLLFPFISSIMFLLNCSFTFFVMIYTPFNLSLFFPVSFHISFFCLSLLAANTAFQSVSFLLIVAFTSSFHHILFGFFPPTCNLNHCPFHLLPHMLNSIISYPTPFPSRDLAYPSVY